MPQQTDGHPPFYEYRQPCGRRPRLSSLNIGPVVADAGAHSVRVRVLVETYGDPATAYCDDFSLTEELPDLPTQLLQRRGPQQIRPPPRPLRQPRIRLRRRARILLLQRPRKQAQQHLQRQALERPPPRPQRRALLRPQQRPRIRLLPLPRLRRRVLQRLQRLLRIRQQSRPRLRPLPQPRVHLPQRLRQQAL